MTLASTQPVRAGWYSTPMIRYKVSVDCCVQLLSQTWDWRTVCVEFISKDPEKVI